MQNEKRLIDANALEKDMRAYADNKAYCGHVELANGILKAVGRIDEAPTVDAVEVVHAKWESVQNGKGCCSNCHRLDSIDSLATHCRYCGAKMDEERKD